MGRTKDSLKHMLIVAALNGITDRDTVRAYKSACGVFAVWAKEQGIKDLAGVSEAIIQRYADYLAERPEQYTASTIHGKLSPVCKAAGINMRRIRKPKRTASRIVRGRSETKTGRGEREAGLPRYERLVSLQQCVGIRRAELARLEGRDLIRDGGQLYINVRRGKGGKNQLQWILPEDRETVRRLFDGIGPNQRVFTAEEMTNHINLHGMRAKHAQRCYQHYAEITARSESAQEALRGLLVKRWTIAHGEAAEGRAGPRSASYKRFLRDMDGRPYKLCGENKAKAEALGLPVVYDRLALMAVSVLHLSHWRLDVTVTNYMIQ